MNDETQSKLVEHLLKENEQLKEKIEKLERDLEFQRMLNEQVRPCRPVDPYNPEIPGFEKTWPYWDKLEGPMCGVQKVSNYAY